MDRIGDMSYMLNFYDYTDNCDGCGSIGGLLCYQDSTFNFYQPDTSKPCNYYTFSINQIRDNNLIKVYPNPAKDKIYIELKEINEMKFFDILGNEILTTKQKEIDVSNLQNGVYFIQLKTVESILTKKIIVQH